MPLNKETKPNHKYSSERVTVACCHLFFNEDPKGKDQRGNKNLHCHKKGTNIF